MTPSIKLAVATAAIALAGACGTASAQATYDNSADQGMQANPPAQATQPAPSRGGVKGYLSRMWHSDRSSSEQAEIDAGNKAAPDTNSHVYRKYHQNAQDMADPSNMPQQGQQDQPQ
jgi:hypothetical protein